MSAAPVTGRFAPTPSGRLHLGNLLCALIAYLSVRREGGRFLLRIEDLDAPRCPRSLAARAMEDLSFLGIRWDEPPLYQSERADAYRRYTEKLTQMGLTYPCFCSRAQLHAAFAPNRGDALPVYAGTCARLTPEEVALRARVRRPALRLRVSDEILCVNDGCQGPYSADLARDCGDFIIRRSDGLSAYHLAVVVDDALSGVTQVVRGRDILPSTPQQIYLQRLLSFPEPGYYHIPLLEDPEGRRLAKRDGDLDLTCLGRRFTRDELLGMLAFSAGLLPENRPIDMDSLIAGFDWARVRSRDIRLPAEIFAGA